jgi:hypothetical protein
MLKSTKECFLHYLKLGIFLKVPPLDDIVDECLKRQHRSRCGSFAKRGRALFSQPDKMVEKTVFCGHHAANMGIMMNLYMQQALGMLLNMLETEHIIQIEKKVRDIFFSLYRKFGSIMTCWGIFSYYT